MTAAAVAAGILMRENHEGYAMKSKAYPTDGQA